MQFMKLIQDLDYIEILHDDIFFDEQEEAGLENDFFDLVGIWKDRDITSENLRARARPNRE